MWSPPLLIASLAFLIYLRSLFFGYTYLDDNNLILDNLRFLTNAGNVFTVFTQDVFRSAIGQGYYYRPLMTLSLMLDAQFGGAAPFIYHLSNVAWHIAASILVYYFFLKINIKQSLALFFAAVFAVHPVLAQAVAWIPGRNDSLLTVFVLGAYLFFLNKKKGWHLAFFALALLTKETAIILPALIWLRERKLLWEWLAVAGGWFLVRFAVVGSNSAPLTSVLPGLPAVFLYVGKIFWPFGLSVLPILQDSNMLPGIIAVAVLSLVFIAKRNYFGPVWFLAFLVPSFLRPNQTIVADFIEHRVYLPLVGLFIALAQTLPEPNKYLQVLVVIVLAAVTVTHSGNFADRMVFWTNAVATSPHSPLAHRNLGAMYFLDKNYDAAETHFKQALELNPVEPMAHNNLGLIYMNRGDYDNAERELKKELELYPNYDNAHYNLGLVYYKEGKQAEAEAQWRRTLELNPNYGVQ